MTGPENSRPTESIQSTIDQIIEFRTQGAAGEIKPPQMVEGVLSRAAQLLQMGVLDNPDISSYLKFVARDRVVWQGLIDRITANRNEALVSPNPELDQQIKADLALAEALGMGENEDISPYLNHLKVVYAESGSTPPLEASPVVLSGEPARGPLFPDLPEVISEGSAESGATSAGEELSVEQLIALVPDEVKRQIEEYRAMERANLESDWEYRIRGTLADALPQIVEEQRQPEEYINNIDWLRIIYSVASPELKAVTEEYCSERDSLGTKLINLLDRFYVLQNREAGIDNGLLNELGTESSEAYWRFRTVLRDETKSVDEVIAEFVNHQRARNRYLRFWNENSPKIKALQDSLIAKLDPQQKAMLEALEKSEGPLAASSLPLETAAATTEQEPAVPETTAAGAEGVVPEEKRAAVEDILSQLHLVYRTRAEVFPPGRVVHESRQNELAGFNDRINALQAQLSDALGLGEEESFQAAQEAEAETNSLHMIDVANMLAESAERSLTDSTAFVTTVRLLRGLYAKSNPEVVGVLDALLNVHVTEWILSKVDPQLVINFNINLHRAAGISDNIIYDHVLTNLYLMKYRRIGRLFEKLVTGNEANRLDNAVSTFKERNRLQREGFQTESSRIRKVGDYERELASKAGMEIFYE